MPLTSTKVLPFGVSAVFSICADAADDAKMKVKAAIAANVLDIAAPLLMNHVEDAGCVAWTNAAEYDLFRLIVVSVENCVAPSDFLEALVRSLLTTGCDRIQNSLIRAKSGGDRDLGDNRLRNHAGGMPRGRPARQRHIAEFFVLKGKFCGFELLMHPRPRQALGEMTPVRRCERTFAIVRAGGCDMRAGGDQLSPQRDDPAIARGRTGLDDQQRVVGFCPHQLRECCSFRVADLADH